MAYSPRTPSTQPRPPLIKQPLLLAEQGAALVDISTAVALRSDDSIWERILEYADSCDAGVIVVGSRGLSGIKSAVLGSVSHGLVNNSRRPVLVVPPVAVGTD